MSILKRKGDIVTSREPESRGKGKVVGKIGIPIKPGSHMYEGSDYIFDEETRSQISQEYQKEKSEYPDVPPVTSYNRARRKILKDRGLELYE